MRYILVGSTVILSVLLGTAFFGILTGDIVFAESHEGGPAVSISEQLLNILVPEIIVAVAGAFGLGIKALFKWLRSKGVEISIEQETMFKDLMTNRFKMLAKSSWETMREDVRKNPKALDDYWKELKTGHIPKTLQDNLRKNGKEFAEKLRESDQFKDFAGKITENAMNRLLKNVRTNLKSDYQKQMIDVLPKLASIAVDATFLPNVKNAKTWATSALKEMKPLLLSTEALSTEDNIMIILKSEVNKRLQKLSV